MNYYGDFQPGRHVAESRDLVTAANALRALVYSGQDQLADRVAKWLIRHRNGNGLFKTAWVRPFAGMLRSCDISFTYVAFQRPAKMKFKTR